MYCSRGSLHCALHYDIYWGVMNWTLEGSFSDQNEACFAMKKYLKTILTLVQDHKWNGSWNLGITFKSTSFMIPTTNVFSLLIVLWKEDIDLRRKFSFVLNSDIFHFYHVSHSPAVNNIYIFLDIIHISKAVILSYVLYLNWWNTCLVTEAKV